MSAALGPLLPVLGDLIGYAFKAIVNGISLYNLHN